MAPCTIAMFTCDAGGAAPALNGNSCEVSVFAAIRFQLVTSFARATAGAASATSAATTAIATHKIRLIMTTPFWSVLGLASAGGRGARGRGGRGSAAHLTPGDGGIHLHRAAEWSARRTPAALRSGAALAPSSFYASRRGWA